MYIITPKKLLPLTESKNEADSDDGSSDEHCMEVQCVRVKDGDMCGRLWARVRVCARVCACVSACGCIWVWVCVGMCGYVWACVGMCGHVWACVGLCAYVWTCADM